VALVEVVDKSRMRRLPAQDLPGLLVRGRIAERAEGAQEAELVVRVFGGDGLDPGG
jgi:hypothetical protein